MVWPESVRPEASVMVPEMPDRPAAAALGEEGLDRADGGLGVEGVEDRLDQQQVGAAVDQAAGRDQVGVVQLGEADVAHAGVVDVGRDRGRAGGGAERAGDVARPRRVGGGDRLDRGAREPRRLVVDLVGELLHAVVAQRDRGGVEGVGLDEVGAGGEVLLVDRGHQLRLGQRQQVVVALEVAGPVGEALAAVAGLVGPVALDRGAHRAVEDEDALAHELGQLRPEIGADERGVAGVVGHPASVGGGPRPGPRLPPTGTGGS